MEKSENPLMQSLNGQWEFAFSKNVMDRPENFYEENFDASSFDKIMVPGHIELAGYDKIRYINTMYPWEGKEYHRGAYSMESTGDEAGMFSEAEYNPVGSYIKRFDLSEQMREKKIRICFEGVEEAMYLWLKPTFWRALTDNDRGSRFHIKSGSWLASDMFIDCKKLKLLWMVNCKSSMLRTITAMAVMWLPGK